jgi:hypothetical protein
MLRTKLNYLYSKLVAVKEVYRYIGIAEKDKYTKIDEILNEISKVDLLMVKKPNIANAVMFNLEKKSEKIINQIKPESWKQYYDTKNMMSNV